MPDPHRTGTSATEAVVSVSGMFPAHPRPGRTNAEPRILYGPGMPGP